MKFLTIKYTWNCWHISLNVNEMVHITCICFVSIIFRDLEGVLVHAVDLVQRASMRWDKLTVCEIVDLKKNIHYSVNFISWLTKIILSLLSSNSQKIVFVLKKILQYNLYMFVIHVHTLIVLVFHNSAGLYFYMFLEFFNALIILSLLHARTLSTSICLSIRWLAHSVMPDIVRLNNISTFVKVPTQLLFSLLESAFLFINSVCLSYTS